MTPFNDLVSALMSNVSQCLGTGNYGGTLPLSETQTAFLAVHSERQN